MCRMGVGWGGAGAGAGDEKEKRFVSQVRRFENETMTLMFSRTSSEGNSTLILPSTAPK